MYASVVLTPAASKRLIAKGVAALPVVRSALQSGRIIVTLGTTNAVVAEELLGHPIDRGAFAAGFIDTRWNVNRRFGEAAEVVLQDGREVEMTGDSALSSLAAGDVLLKGGNALDPWGSVGVLMAATTGGTVGRYVAPALARGVDIVIPISVAKSVHTSIAELSLQMGVGRLALHDGLPCGMYPLSGQVISEIEALEFLFAVHAIHVASGGVGPGTGSVSLLLEGEDDAVRAAHAFVGALDEEQAVELSGTA